MDTVLMGWWLISSLKTNATQNTKERYAAKILCSSIASNAWDVRQKWLAKYNPNLWQNQQVNQRPHSGFSMLKEGNAKVSMQTLYLRK